MDIRQAVTEFVDCYYKPERLNRFEETRENLIEHRVQEIKSKNSTLISRHDSNFGRAIWLVRDPDTGLMQAK